MKILFWAFRSLKAQKQISLFFILNLALGLSGFLLLDSFRSSLATTLELNSKNFLSADLSVSARRALQESEIKSTREAFKDTSFQESRMIEMYSMLSSVQGSRLVQLKAIDENYPFYGQLVLRSGRVISSISKDAPEILTENRVWVYPELLIQMNLKVGDSIQIGEAKFLIAEEIVDDATQTFRISSLAPKVYMSRKNLQQTQLLQKGSTLWEALLIKTETSSEDIRARSKNLFQLIPDPAVQVTTAKQAGEESARVLTSLSDYMGLVSLVALFLALIGTGYLFRNYFVRQLKSIAISQVLGMSYWVNVKLVLIQVLILSLSAWVLSMSFSFLSFPLFQQLLESVSNLKVPFQLSLRIILVSLSMAIVASLSISGYFFLRLRQLRPQQLFQENNSVQVQFSKASLIYFIIPLVAFWILSILQARSFSMGSIFFGLLIGSLVLLMLISIGLLKWIGLIFQNSGWMLKSVSRSLSRKWSQSLAGILALGIGSLLMTVLPQIQKSIQTEIARPEGLKIPALFLFDIQDDQVAPLNGFLKERGFAEVPFSALVRSRLISINQQPFEKRIEGSQFQSREQESENRFRNRGFNLSFREKLSNSESIFAGKFWTEKFDPNKQKYSEISLEKKFAENIKVRLGDILKFDIQGLEVEAQVTSLREVKWNSFQPNFFVIFQPGILEEAPKTWLASLPKLPGQALNVLQSEISRKFSNVSAVDVARSIEKLLDITQKMSGSLEIMAILSFITGFFVLYSVISSQLQEAIGDLNLQKILGISAFKNLSMLLLQYGFLAFLASALGALMSYVVAAILMSQLFSSTALFDAIAMLKTISVVVVLTMVLICGLAFRVLGRRASLNLNS